MKPLRLLFLDVDGVLNDENTITLARDQCKQRTAHDREAHMRDMIDLKYVERLNTLVERARATIVVSSSWRYLFVDMEELRDFFKSIGIDPKKILGRTPRGFPGQKFSEYSLRGFEIQHFINKMTPVRDVSSIVILDDNSDMVHLKHRLIQTNGFRQGLLVGLTDEDVEKAVKLFDVKDKAHLNFNFDEWNYSRRNRVNNGVGE